LPLQRDQQLWHLPTQPPWSGHCAHARAQPDPIFAWATTGGPASISAANPTAIEYLASMRCISIN
jgi:hypothetical protein